MNYRTLTIRLSPDEVETISRAAKASGLKLGPYLRSVGMLEFKIRVEKQTPKVYLEEK